MKVFDVEDVINTPQGKIILIYGPTGIGKTCSVLQSAPLPIGVVQFEERSLKTAITAADRPELKNQLNIFQYEGWEDFLEFLENKSRMIIKLKTLFLDNISYLMNIHLSEEIENEAFQARSETEQKIKPIVSKSKLTIEGYGGLSGNMNRMMRRLGKYSKQGVNIVITALEQQYPKWNRELAAAPALKGREFSDSMPSYFDLIGRVESRIKDDKITYPPKIVFAGEEDFLHKWTGKTSVTAGPLNLTKIFSIE